MFLNNRYHDPTLGTFISVDPLVVKTGQPYIYGGGNPIMFSDPSGLCIEPNSLQILYAPNDDGGLAASIMGGPMELNRDFSEFIACSTARDVRFLIVGGYAVAAHGHPRYTKDLDVWVRVDPENARRIVDALGDFGFGGLGLAVEDFLADDVVVQLGREPQRIDLLTFVSGVEFDEEQRACVRPGRPGTAAGGDRVEDARLRRPRLCAGPRIADRDVQRRAPCRSRVGRRRVVLTRSPVLVSANA